MSKKIVVTGGSLLHLAAKAYKDATLWPYIARANNMTEPFIKGTRTVIIPENTGFKTGGLPLNGTN